MSQFNQFGNPVQPQPYGPDSSPGPFGTPPAGHQTGVQQFAPPAGMPFPMPAPPRRPSKRAQVARGVGYGVGSIVGLLVLGAMVNPHNTPTPKPVGLNPVQADLLNDNVIHGTPRLPPDLVGLAHATSADARAAEQESLRFLLQQNPGSQAVVGVYGRPTAGATGKLVAIAINRKMREDWADAQVNESTIASVGEVRCGASKVGVYCVRSGKAKAVAIMLMKPGATNKVFPTAAGYASALWAAQP